MQQYAQRWSSLKRERYEANGAMVMKLSPVWGGAGDLLCISLVSGV